ncbi:hypothetical protein EGR_07820 [Echinococcus granulosus]|uniref:Transmembrane protein n=1 Tax=Echinococcus granulosus TaxID=6210 RepID=W6UV18_ECHGR|nr:hypothetical protein EGR_07820 [Echinococcus granulosus]EUB57284.1 hypothetical protein EGR_07820 [Echinococcus granulosus]
MPLARLFIIDVTILTFAGLSGLLSLTCFSATIHWAINAESKCEGCIATTESRCLSSNIIVKGSRQLLAGAPAVPKFIALGCGCSLTAFVIGVLRLHLEKIGRHKHSRIAYIALLSSGSMSMLIALVIWGDMAAHMSTKVIEQRRMSLLRNYFRLLNANIYENRTALVHVVTEHIAAARNHLTDASLVEAFQNLYFSWPFGVAVTAEIFLFMATVLYLTRKDFKVAPQQFPV